MTAETDDAVDACVICFGSVPPPVQSGCACRSDSGLVHAACLIRKALVQEPHRGGEAWRTCQTCNQTFTGPIRTALAREVCSRAQTLPELSYARLYCEEYLADSLCGDGAYAESVLLSGKVLASLKCKLGSDHPATLMCAHRLARKQAFAGDYRTSEETDRAVLASVCKRFGAQNARTLLIAEHHVYTTRARALGEDHPLTLKAAMLLEALFQHTEGHGGIGGKTQKLVDHHAAILGSEHPTTIRCSRFLAQALTLQARHVEAKAIAEATFRSAQRVLGPSHPTTVACSQTVMSVLAGCAVAGPHGIASGSESDSVPRTNFP